MRVVLTILVLIAAFALIVGATGNASSNGTIYMQKGIWCQTAAGGVACVRSDGKGYGMGFSKDAVLVMRFDSDGSRHSVFKKYQP